MGAGLRRRLGSWLFRNRFGFRALVRGALRGCRRRRGLWVVWLVLGAEDVIHDIVHGRLLDRSLGALARAMCLPSLRRPTRSRFPVRLRCCCCARSPEGHAHRGRGPIARIIIRGASELDIVPRLVIIVAASVPGLHALVVDSQLRVSRSLVEAAPHAVVMLVLQHLTVLIRAGPAMGAVHPAIRPVPLAVRLANLMVAAFHAALQEVLLLVASFVAALAGPLVRVLQVPQPRLALHDQLVLPLLRHVHLVPVGIRVLPLEEGLVHILLVLPAIHIHHSHTQQIPGGEGAK